MFPGGSLNVVDLSINIILGIVFAVKYLGRHGRLSAMSFACFQTPAYLGNLNKLVQARSVRGMPKSFILRNIDRPQWTANSYVKPPALPVRIYKALPFPAYATIFG